MRTEGIGNFAVLEMGMQMAAAAHDALERTAPAGNPFARQLLDGLSAKAVVMPTTKPADSCSRADPTRFQPVSRRVFRSGGQKDAP
jgi:hypothetical protein